MKEAGLSCKTKRRFKVTADSKHDLPIAPNYLNRQFAVAQVNQVYAGDITYTPTLEGRLYLAAVIDLFSPRVVGWSMAVHMKTELLNRVSSKVLTHHVLVEPRICIFFRLLAL